MSTALIMPTVRVPQNLRAWADQLGPDDLIVIAGNECSPHKEIQRAADACHVQTIYLHPHGGYSQGLRINRWMEPNHHHRRNFALLYALENTDIDTIITVDDDNFPAVDTWVKEAVQIVHRPNRFPVIHNTGGFVNPGVLCTPRVTHRGYPLTVRHHESYTTTLPHNETIGVFAGLWYGDPDIDALERIVNDPMVTGIDTTMTWGRGTWAPFDSQATVIARRIAPLLFMWPGVGRYDDIWASYMARAVMDHRGEHVAYGHPAVRQERNPHNLLKDLDAERMGYELTETLCELLRGIDLNDANSDIISQMALCADVIQRQMTSIPNIVNQALVAWFNDLDDRVKDL